MAVRRYHVCLRPVGLPNTGQIALAALGTTLIITEPSCSTASLAIRQRSVPTSISAASTAASCPPDYSRSSLTGSPSPNLRTRADAADQLSRTECLAHNPPADGGHGHGEAHGQQHAVQWHGAAGQRRQPSSCCPARPDASGHAYRPEHAP